MKTIFTLLAKLFMLVVWAVFITNFIRPFPGIAHIALNVMAIFTIFMHGLQSLLFSGDALGKDVQLTRREKISIFIFGTFALIDIKNKYLK